MTLTTIRLNENALAKVRANKHLRNRLQLELNKSASTIQRYLNDNSEDLTTATALKIIGEETGLEQSEILSA